jgi:hypothetical protein
MLTLLSRLVLAQTSPGLRVRSHGLSVPAYPSSLFPFLASFSALGLTCLARISRTTSFLILQLVIFRAEAAHLQGLVQLRACLSSLG